MTHASFSNGKIQIHLDGQMRQVDQSEAWSAMMAARFASRVGQSDFPEMKERESQIRTALEESGYYEVV